MLCTRVLLHTSHPWVRPDAHEPGDKKEHREKAPRARGLRPPAAASTSLRASGWQELISKGAGHLKSVNNLTSKCFHLLLNVPQSARPAAAPQHRGGGTRGPSHGDFLHHTVSDVDFVRLDSDSCRLTAQMLVVLPVLKGEHTPRYHEGPPHCAVGSRAWGRGRPTLWPSLLSAHTCPPSRLRDQLTWQTTRTSLKHTKTRKHVYILTPPAFQRYAQKKYRLCKEIFISDVVAHNITCNPKGKKNWSQPLVHRRVWWLWLTGRLGTGWVRWARCRLLPVPH